MIRKVGDMLRCWIIKLEHGLSNIQGVPVSGSRLHVEDWAPTEECMYRPLDCWKARTQSLGGRVTRINACLTSMPVYCFSMYTLPNFCFGEIGEGHQEILLAGKQCEEKKYQMARWPLICRPKRMKGWVSNTWKDLIWAYCVSGGKI